MEFKFHQSLYGYDGGHQLLAASQPLSTEARHFLAVITDLSGSAPARGFDYSYTGAPLPGTKFYAFFCTWLAPEMPRPGCVWTHVLLIDLADIAELQDLGALRTLFLRPLPAPRLEDFSRPLSFLETPHASVGVSPIHKTVAADLLAALYAEPDMPIVMPAVEESMHEELIFALWSQQWPRLRRSFRFSTGSFADRGRGGPAFDVQITPEANVSAWNRSGAHVLGSSGPKSTALTISTNETWLRSALDDLSSPDSHGLRIFLRTYGADVNSLRAAFRPLARTHARFTGLGGAEPWKSTLQEIAAEFPAPDEARTLKQASFSNWSSLPTQTAPDRLLDSIRFLCFEDTAGAFAKVDFNFSASLPSVWPARREELGAILAQPPLTEARWTALANALATLMSGEEIPWLWEAHPELLITCVRLNPKLATAPDVWRLPDRSQWTVVEALEASVISENVWRDITRAMLIAGTTVAAREIAQRAGSAALEGALEWIANAKSESLPPVLWREALRPLAEERLSRDALDPAELAFCAAIVPTTIAAKLPASRPDVQALASVPLESLPVPLQLPTAFLLVTIGLQASEDVGAVLLARGFFAVHDALEGAAEPPEAWRLLRPHLPMLWFWEEWDRCLKLRRGLAKWVHEHPQALDTILAAARNPTQRKWLESLR